MAEPSREVDLQPTEGADSKTQGSALSENELQALMESMASTKIAQTNPHHAEAASTVTERTS